METATVDEAKVTGFALVRFRVLVLGEYVLLETGLVFILLVAVPICTLVHLVQQNSRNNVPNTVLYETRRGIVRSPKLTQETVRCPEESHSIKSRRQRKISVISSHLIAVAGEH